VAQPGRGLDAGERRSAPAACSPITAPAADSDPEGDAFFVSAVNGMAVVGTEIILASGAKLTVNADGTYSYNPNGKFNTLTDNTSGAVNTSRWDTFTYTITGGSTATVTVTVNGVAGPGDC
jgi:VCBS repeat-containing protein